MSRRSWRATAGAVADPGQGESLQRAVEKVRPAGYEIGSEG